jgi:hypothetical protein
MLGGTERISSLLCVYVLDGLLWVIQPGILGYPHDDSALRYPGIFSWSPAPIAYFTARDWDMPWSGAASTTLGGLHSLCYVTLYHNIPSFY